MVVGCLLLQECCLSVEGQLSSHHWALFCLEQPALLEL